MINKKILLIILFLAFFMRSYYSLTDDNLFGSDSYYHYRIAEYFVENNRLPERDEMYSGGRDYVYLPLFHLILGLLGKVFPLMTVAKLFSSITGILYIFICYLIFRRERMVWLFLLLLATFPVLLFKQAGYLLTDNLSLLFIALLVLFYRTNNIAGFLSTFVAYSFTHLSVAFFSVVFSLASIYSRNVKLLLASLSPFLLLALFFPAQLLHHSQNIPPQLTNEIFQFYGLKFLVLKELGLPVFAGLAIFLWRRPRFDKNFLFLLIPIILFPLKVITLDRSLAYSAIPLAYFAWLGIRSVKKHRMCLIVVVLILSFFSAYLALNQLQWGVMDNYEKSALDYLSADCNVVLTSNFGHWVTAYGCKVFFDDVYTTDSGKRYDVLSKIYNLDDKSLIMLK